MNECAVKRDHLKRKCLIEPMHQFSGDMLDVRGWLLLNFQENSNRPLEHTPDMEKVQHERIPFINRCFFWGPGYVDPGYVGIFVDNLIDSFSQFIL